MVLIESAVITLPVAASDNKELAAPIAPPTKMLPVPAESVSERVPAVLPSTVSRSWIAPPAPAVPPVPPTAERVTLALSVAASLIVMLPALPPLPGALPLPPVVVRLPPSVMPPAVASIRIAPPWPPGLPPEVAVLPTAVTAARATVLPVSVTAPASRPGLPAK